jgi:D-alanine--poly(phosphoribitol) ligase subunit 1
MFQEIILDQFLTIIKNYGPNNAFCINEKFYTYSEFARNISMVRNAILASGTLGKNVGLVANDDIETYASIFAIWLQGLAYVPLHPANPEDRNLEIISQADIELVINSNGSMLPGVKNINSSLLEFDKFNLEAIQAPDSDLAYILFTSGSTGKPKGVPLMRSNVAAFMKSFLEVGFEITSDDRCLQCFDLTFDVSVQSFLIPLIKGACTFTVPHDQIKYSYVYGLLEDHQLTFGAVAPSMIRYLRKYFDEIDLPAMRYNILTAEASPLDLVEEWSKCIPNAEIFDFYGPTETTIYCTYYKLNRNKSQPNKQLNGLLSIGKIMNGLTAIIIDENDKILGPNQKGQLCIAGPQLTQGYWNNPEKTNESFFEINYNGIPTRFYKTGDSCIMDDDNDILYSGRLDFQVKIQGYRIELGEIEHNARIFINGRNAVAIAAENKTGNTEIALFIEGELADVSFLVDYLKTKMPSYMIPSQTIILDTLPLNSNGKVDRKTLKELIKF